MTPLQAWLIARVRQGLIDKNWAQVQLADAAGISQKHLSQVLSGHAAATVTLWDRLLSLVDARP